MWYFISGDLMGQSLKDNLEEAFKDVIEIAAVKEGRYPHLGIITEASKKGFDMDSDDDALFCLTHFLLEKVGMTKAPDDSILDEEFVDAPNSRENHWDDVIDI